MVSILPQSVLLSLNDRQPELNELGNLRDAVDPFAKQILRTGKSAIHLHCAVSTWCHSSDTCLDLHDLHELRSRFLIFIHDLMTALRKMGISATYSLSPSNTSLCLVCALPPELCSSEVKASALAALQKASLSKRDNVLLADLEYGPALIIT